MDTLLDLKPLLLYYITDRIQLGADETTRRERLLGRIADAAGAGVDYVQLRERDLTIRKLERLATQAVEALRGTKAKLLINSRVDVALAAEADGVHLRSTDIAASEARATWAKAATTRCVVAVSCHSLTDVLGAEAHGADFAVFGPVFGKQGSPDPPVGIEAIAGVVRRGGPADKKVEAGQSLKMPVIALGSITLENAAACLRAGAAGIAGIRLFQQGDVTTTVKQLRSSGER